MSDSMLRHYWHPVATSAELGETPVGARLLDEQIVVFRIRDRVVAFRDLCVHRGTPLSLGRVEGENLICAYHGWAYAPDGACVRIPSLDPAQGIPRKARATPYLAEERYGIIWVCLDEPHAPLPDLPELEDARYHTFWLAGGVWETSAGRMIENFADFTHFAFVHPGINGTPDDPLAPEYKVERRGDELHYAADLPLLPGGLAGDLGSIVAKYHWRIILPFTCQLARDMPEGRRMVVTIMVSPVSAKRIRRFLYSSRNFALDQPDEEFRKVGQVVADQDKRIVERQRPEELPTDLAEELHLKGPDAAALAYRQMLADLGLHVA